MTKAMHADCSEVAMLASVVSVLFLVRQRREKVKVGLAFGN